jgi:hypothetical protein
VHIPSKLYRTGEEQTIISGRIVKKITEYEQSQGHTRTLVIGDFNMNPFETGLVSPDGFHGVMDKQIAMREKKIVQGEEKQFFYNPMWSRLGDGSVGCAGTYYYDKNMINFFWNTFDQVLIRPSLLPCFHHNDLHVIDKVNEISLLKSGKISKQFSDHLPIMIKLTVTQLSGD